MSDECCARTRLECENDCDEYVKQLKQQLEACQKQLKEAVEVIEFYLSKDLSDCIFKSDEDRHRQFLAKYRGEK